MDENILVVAGPRDFWNRGVVSDALVDAICDFEIDKVITGDARGVDALVAELCFQSGMYFEVFPADWDKFGKSAGPRRNWHMATIGTHLLAFDKSTPGTQSMIYFAERHGLTVRKIDIRKENVR